MRWRGKRTEKRLRDSRFGSTRGGKAKKEERTKIKLKVIM
jgi:hypothetical protein